MIRMFQLSNAAQAKGYFKTALERADYYIEGHEHEGIWHGKIAQRLGLENKAVTTDIFNKLCDNLHPETGENLTPRTVSNRRIGYDTSFHCPKSVSILHALGTDKRIMSCFTQSSYETLCEMQDDMQTRVRLDNQYHDRTTGEMLWASFVHETARPTQGHAPDMHLHQHNILMNVTWDETEQRYKAGQFHNLKLDMPYYQARFQKRLADKLQHCGYGIRKTQNGFEVTTIPQKAIEYFSKRTNHIGQVAKEQEITDPKELDSLGARTRTAKDKSLTMQELKSAWRADMKRHNIDATLKEEKPTQKNLSAEQAIDHTLDHAFARASVRRERQLKATAYLHAIDQNSLSMDELDQSLSKDQRIFTIKDVNQSLCTTALVHREERDMVRLAMGGRGKLRPLVSPNYEVKNDVLGDDQKKALTHILTSSDQLTMIRGGAGTGKTTLIRTAVEEIQKTGKYVFAFAPTSNAARDTLRHEGFDHADTVARLLKDPSFHEPLKGQVIWIDEAGMLGTKDMHDIQVLSQTLNARLIISGDPRQHTAVDRGDAMTILQRVAKLPYVSLETIYRQKVEHYKESVHAISQGRIKEGFQKLDQMGVIKELETSEDINTHLIQDYIKGLKNKKDMLVISPTNEQSDKATASLRTALKEHGFINKRDRTFNTYKNRHLTEAQKKDHRTYVQGQILQVHQNMKGVKKGCKIEILEATDQVIKGQTQKGLDVDIPLNRAKDFDVYIPVKRNLTKGDQIRITKNGSDAKGKRLDNGWTLSVDGFSPSGNILATKKSKFTSSQYEIGKEHGNFDHAYCLTSYGAQGKSVDQVLIVQPSATFPATNMKQFYVSVSRAKEAVHIYTDDKDALLSHAEKTCERLSALDIKPIQTPYDPMEISLNNEKEKERSSYPKPSHDYDKEPHI